MKILIIGACSRIAQSVCAKLKEYELYLTDHRGRATYKLDLELCDKIPVELTQVTFDYALVFAGATNMSWCEQNPDKAMHINSSALSALKSVLRVKHWVSLSTNQVFSGNSPFVMKEAFPTPFNHYGATKMAMERELFSPDGDNAVIRLTKVITPEFGLFHHFIQQLKLGMPVEVFDDMTMAPVTLCQVSEFIYQLLHNFRADTFQLSGKEDASYYHIVSYLASSLGCNTDLLLPVAKTVDSPQFTSLHVDKLEQDLGFTPLMYQGVIDWFVSRLGKG